jgi:aminotransferase
MEHLLNARVRDIQISGIRKFSNMMAQVPDAISLTIGQPDFPTPEHVKQAGKQAIDENHTVYTSNAGLLETRQAVAQFVKTKYQLSYDPGTEIILTNGATEAIDITLRTVLSPADEVILPGPVYPGYEPVIHMLGANAVHVDTTENGFKMTADLIEPFLSEKTRCVIIPSPSNPTGCTLAHSELQEIVELLKDRNIFVISDEIYSELVYGEDHHSIAAFPQMRNKTIVINGLSKSHSMTGWRIGFTLAPSYITQHMLKVHQYSASCASSISQYAALEALTTGLHDAEAMRAEYAKRRDYVVDRLSKMGFDIVLPNGAFYVFPSIKQFGKDSFSFATELLHEAKVAVVPGSAFSQFGEGYIRISYATDLAKLQQAMDRIEHYIKQLKS